MSARKNLALRISEDERAELEAALAKWAPEYAERVCWGRYVPTLAEFVRVAALEKARLLNGRKKT